MGAGSSTAGTGGAGLDPVAAHSPPRVATPPVALYFDGATADFPLDANGRYRGIHPIDQAVALALLIRRGTLGSAPTVGARFREIRKVTRATPNEAESMARSALAALVKAQDISIRSIQVETRRKAGSVAIAVSYVNLRANPPRPAVARTTLNG